MARSLAAVLGGYLVISLTTIVAFVGLNALAPGQLNQPAWLLVKLGLAVLGALLGGLFAARLAPARPAAHAGALGGLMLALAIAAVAVSFGSEPLWFQLALILVSAAAVIAGGQLAIRRGWVAARRP